MKTYTTVTLCCFFCFSLFQASLTHCATPPKDPVGDANARTAATFLSKNKEREGVYVTKSGLQYEVVRQGKTTPRPSPTDLVKIEYKGTLIDGTIFEDTNALGRPALIYIDKTFPGWSEGLQLMPVGSKYKFYIPPGLAYGDKDMGPIIKKNSVLIIDVELLEIVDKQKMIEDRPSPIDPSSVNLSSPLQTARTYLLLYTNIIPGYVPKDLFYVCEAVAVDTAMKKCQSFLQERVDTLQKLAIDRANFTDKHIGTPAGDDGSIDISWQEQFELSGGKKTVTDKKINLKLQKIDDQWRVESGVDVVD